MDFSVCVGGWGDVRERDGKEITTYLKYHKIWCIERTYI